ncbi:MAG: AraC family transcriptional regulator [Lachnospiraceae bacterium]|nr:AraC family transcriptional regulator [Lachnospiraceae bacterium]
MDWVTGIQKAIDYIENHITEKLDYEEIAENAFSSPYHFQRVFSILCGYTLGEYIRNRRLALAGTELAADKIKVIDAAVKYGYDSPDSFTRAFTRFHGITPSAAREPGVRLLRKRIVEEWLPSSGYLLSEAPEISVTHWFREPDKEKRYIELWIPVVKAEDGR